jgi:hypothetical protein
VVAKKNSYGTIPVSFILIFFKYFFSIWSLF